MKVKIFIWISLIIIGFVSCEKSEEIKIDSIVDTKWKLTQIIDKSGEISNFPSDIDDFEIVFRKSGEIDLTNLCNYSFGKYTLNSIDLIEVYNIGAGTEKYCLPYKSMDWETKFINSLILSQTYSIANNKLTIDCRDNKLVFGFESTYDSNKGKVIFLYQCTHDELHIFD